MRSTNDLIRTAVRVELARRNETQSSLAAAIGKSAAWLSQRLSGDVQIGLDDVDAIAAGLDLTPAELIARAHAEQAVAS